MGLYSRGLIIGRIFASEILGAYFREGLFFGELIIGILRYIVFPDVQILDSVAQYGLEIIKACTTAR